jgi:hypothetical protein
MARGIEGATAGRPCELRGGVIVRHVYAADLFSVVLRGPRGESIRDDLLLALAGVRTVTIKRRLDPPPHAIKFYDPDAADGQTFATGLGPCPKARDAARRLIDRAAAVEVRIPVTGPGWLESLGVGARVYGDLWLAFDGGHDDGPEWSPIAAELIKDGHVTSTNEAAA